MSKATKCKVYGCKSDARWIVSYEEHPNGDVRAAYCHEHAQTRASGLWDESPRPYRVVVAGPFDTVHSWQL